MFKLLGITGIILALVSGAFYWYYTSSQNTIATLNQEKAALAVSIDIQNQTINSLEQNYQLANHQLEIVNQDLNTSRQQNRELQERLSRHELGFLAVSRPVLVERTINNATRQVNRCFEILSGSELTERELNAASPRAANSECPWLFE